MADTSTANYNFIKPEVGASATTWGAKLNSDLDMIDAQLFTSAGALTSSNLNLSSNPGTGVVASLAFLNGGSATGQKKRWALTEDVSAETGGNVGSNLSLTAYNDTGALLSTPMAINRASGAITFNTATSFTAPATFGALNVTTVTATTVNANTVNANVLGSNGALNVIGAATLGSTLNVIGAATLAGLTVAGGASVGNGLVVNNTLNVASGGAEVSGGVTVSGGLNVASGGVGITGNVGIAGNVAVNGTLAATGNVSAPNFVLPSGGGLEGPNLASLTCDGTNWFMYNTASGNFLLENNNAFKPGGGPWATLSDARIKTVTGEYEPGLDEVMQLRPVTYRYKTGADREFVGLVAQEAEHVLPGMVSRQKGFIDGEEVTDLRTLDTTELIFALVNCVKQLKAEIEELKAG